jgi:iron complex outermembrane receptor protein
MKLHRSHICAFAAAQAASLLAVPAVLRAADTSAQLEEIVVTARQREEKIEDVPVTITAFTQTEIKNAGIVRPEDFIALTSGVSVVHTAEAGDMQVNIRGINTSRDAETNFALVVDGVLQTNAMALNRELAGVTQIEILKGPQGAVYGRNAVAGAMIITTRKPGDEWDGEAKAGYGTDNTYNASLYAGGPLADGLKGSLQAYTRHTDGQFKNSLRNCSDCVDYFEESGAEGRLLFGLAGGDMDFKAKYSKMSSGAINFNASIALKDVADAAGFGALNEDPNHHKFVYLNNIKPKNEQENINLSLKGDWDVGLGTLTSYVAYNDQTNYFLTDGASGAFYLYALNPVCQASFAARAGDTPVPPPFNYGNPAPDMFTSFLPPYGPTTCDGYQYQQRDQKDASIEVRLSSPSEQRLRWLGGMYFANIDRTVVVSQGADLNQGMKPKAFIPWGGTNPTDLLYDDDYNSKVYAVFGQLAYDVVENLELALALRYDYEDRSVDNNVPVCTGTDTTSCRAQTPGFGAIWYPPGSGQPYINPAYTVNPSFATAGIPSRSKSYDQLQPKLSANWKVTDAFTAYASYGYGFRSGGFNSSGSEATINYAYGLAGFTPLCLGSSYTPPTGCNSSNLNITDVHDDYKKEISKAAEIGFKSYLADRTISLNGAVFYTKVDDMQFFNFFAGPFGLLRAVTNIDKVTLQGFELDTHVNLGEYFSVYGGFGYTDSNIDEYKGRPYTKGNKVPYAPEYTGNLGAEFSYPMTQAMKVLVRLDANFIGETYFHPVQDERLPNLFTYFNFGQGDFSKQKRDPYQVLNLRVGLEGERWSVTGWGKNITDENYLQEIIPAPEFGGSFIHDSPGAAWGVDLGFKF